MVRIPKTQKVRIDLRKFFTREAKRNIIGSPNKSYPTYKSLLRMKKGVKLDNAPDNDEVTAKRKGKNQWMVHTGETQRQGFLFRAKKKELLVYASKAKHSGNTYYMTKAGKTSYKQKKPPTYEKIFQWHNKRGYSGVFGQLPVGSKFPERLVKEVGKQFEPQITKGIKKVYRVKWGGR